MDTSTSASTERTGGTEGSSRMLDGIGEQVAAVDQLIGLARQSIRVFDLDMVQMGWNSPARAKALAAFLHRSPEARLQIIVHDTRHIESACPRLLALLRQSSASMTIYRAAGEARRAMDPMVIVDERHYLHRFHAEQPRAELVIDAPALAQPLLQRFDEIWATGEPGVGATVLGL